VKEHNEHRDAPARPVPGTSAVGDGYFEDGLRSSIMGVVAGGTGDIQRNLVARAMGLPR